VLVSSPTSTSETSPAHQGHSGHSPNPVCLCDLTLQPAKHQQQKELTLLLPDVFSAVKIVKNALAIGATPRTPHPLESLQRSPDLSWTKGKSTEGEVKERGEKGKDGKAEWNRRREEAGERRLGKE